MTLLNINVYFLLLFGYTTFQRNRLLCGPIGLIFKTAIA